jgi:GNAT superfamily N-acetyltransferase
MTYTIRRVASRAELREAFDTIGTFFVPAISASDKRRFDDLDRRFDDDRPLMLVVETDERIVGGVFGFRGAAHATLRMIAVDPRYRRRGVGSRLVQTLEVAAMGLGVRGISLGPSPDAKGFYESLGFRGWGSMHKDLPLPGRVLDRRLARLRGKIGDLDAGVPLRVDDGRVAALL